MTRVGTLDDIAEMLEATGQYRCLRRVPAFENRPYAGDIGALKIGAVIDVEATGTDPLRDTPIEIAIVKFAFEPGGEIIHVLGEFSTLGEPPEPLSLDVETITGLTTTELAGRAIDWDGAIDFVADANCLIAHNARYDRTMLETACPRWPIKAWACSLADIDWRAEAQYDRRLSDLLLAHDLYAPGHRALADCRSLLHLLTLPLPRSCRPTFEALLEGARRFTAVFFAEAAPFDATPAMRQRGYRWLGALSDARVPRCWSIEVPLAAARDEAIFLRDHVYPAGSAVKATVTVVNAFHRYRPMPAIAIARVPAPVPSDDD